MSDGANRQARATCASKYDPWIVAIRRFHSEKVVRRLTPKLSCARSTPTLAVSPRRYLMHRAQHIAVHRALAGCSVR
jgi:hypothetical protein